MRRFYISVLLLLLSVELLSQPPKKKAPVKPIIHVLKVDTPIQVNIITLPSTRDTVFIDGIPTINIKQEENYFKDYVAPLIAPLFTLLGVFLGVWLNTRKDKRIKSEERKQKRIDDLTAHKIKAEGLIRDLTNHILDASQASTNINIWRSVNNVETLGGKHNYDKQIAKSEESLEYNSKRIYEILSEFRTEVGFFHTHFRENIMFEEMVETLNEFDPQIEELKRPLSFDESQKAGNKFVRDFGYFTGIVLKRFTDLMDYYLRELPERNDSQIREFEINVWHDGTTFTTEVPPENPSGSIEEQLDNQEPKS